MDAVNDLTLAEAVALVGGFDPRTGEAIRPGVFSHGNIFLAESAALLIGLADDGCIELERAQTSKLIPGAATTHVLAGTGEPTHPLLLAPHRVVVSQRKPTTADRLVAKISSRPIHDRLVASGLMTRTGRLVKRDSLTPAGLQVRADLCAELDGFASGAEVDASAVNELAAMVVAVLLAGLVAQPLHLGQDRQTAIESGRRLALLSERVTTVGEHASHRAQLLAALRLANAGFVT